MKRNVMKLLCLFILTFIITGTVPVSASDSWTTTYNGFTISVEYGIAQITGYSGTHKNMVIPTVIYSDYMGGGPVPIMSIANGTVISSEYAETLTFLVDESGSGSLEVGNGVFNLPNLKKITFNAGLNCFAEIDNGSWNISSAFSTNCQNVTEIVIAEGTDLYRCDFSSFPNLESLTISDRTTYFSGEYICSNKKLKNITVSENNQDLSASDNIVYNKDKTELVTMAYGATPANVDIPDSVTKIRDYAFYQNTSVTGIDLHEGITRIENYAFAECTNLKTMTLPSTLTGIGEYVFQNCDSLTAAAIPAGLRTVSDCAFAYCDNLTEVTIAEGVEVIAGGVFYNCTSLKSVTLPQSLKKLSSAFGGCSSLETLEIPQSLTYMDAYFNGCTSLKDITLPSFITGFSSYAFSGCASLTSITVPEKVTELPNGLFSGCTSLKTIILSDSVKEIGDGVFSGCTALENFHIGKSVTGLELRTLIYEGNNVYSYSPDRLEKLAASTNLKNITVSEENPEFSSVDGNLYSKDKTTLYKYAIGKTDTSFTVPSYVTNIEQYAFQDAVNLTTILLSENLSNINKNSFEGCTNLVYNTLDGATYLGNTKSSYAALFSVENVSTITEFTIGSGTTVIAGEVFSGATKLTTVTFPKTVKGVGANAFYKCSSITRINVEDLGAWAMIDFMYYGNPLSYGKASLYVNSSPITELVIPEGTTKIGQSAFQNYDALTSVTFPKTLKEIGHGAFSSCDGLTSVEFNEGLETIATYAFGVCSNLEYVSFPKTIKSIDDYDVFYYCSKLTKINIADVSAWCNAERSSFVTTYYYDLYVNNVPAETLVIPSDVEKINDYAFTYAQNVKNVVISEGVKELGKYAVSRINAESITIPKSLKTIDDSGFEALTYLKSVYITDLEAWCNIDYLSIWSDAGESNPLSNGASLYLNGKIVENLVIDFATTSSEYSFINCPSIKTVVFSGNANNVGWQMFYGCSNLESVTITSENVETINYSAFENCINLSNVVLNEGLKEIGGNAFANCSKITALNIPSTLTKIDRNAFNKTNNITKLDIADLAAYNAIDMYYDSYSSSNGAYPVKNTATLYIKGAEAKNLIFPEGVTSIPYRRFYKFQNIEYVSLPDTVKTVSSTAFAYCTGLKKVTVLNGDAKIVSNAFYGCTNVGTVEFAGTEAQLKAASSVLYAASDITYLRKVEIYSENISYEKDFVEVGTVLDFEEMGYNKSGFETVVYKDAEHTLKVNKNAPVTEHSVFYINYELGKDIITDVVGGMVTSTPVNYDKGGEMIFAFYKNNRLTDVQSTPYIGEAVTVTSNAEYDTVKTMIWQSMASMTPIDDAKTVKASTDTDYINGTFTVNLNCFNGECDVILALYSSNRLVDVQRRTYSGNDVTFTTSEVFDSAKVMTWYDNMKPVTSCENVKLGAN